jgi:hypothetical protein
MEFFDEVFKACVGPSHLPVECGAFCCIAFMTVVLVLYKTFIHVIIYFICDAVKL